MARGTPRQMPFLPARADPNYLLRGSFCVGTKQPSSVHSDVCKQLLPLISTAMLSKHTFPPAATGTVAKHRLTQFAARGVEVSPQGLFCVCQPSRWEFRSRLGPFPVLGSLWDTREHAPGSDVHHCQRLPRMNRAGWAHPPQVPHSPGGRGRHWGYPLFWPNNKDKPDRLLDGNSLPGSTRARGKELHHWLMEKQLWGRTREITSFATRFDQRMFPPSSNNSRTWSHRSRLSQRAGDRFICRTKKSEALKMLLLTRWQANPRLETLENFNNILKNAPAILARDGPSSRSRLRQHTCLRSTLCRPGKLRTLLSQSWHSAPITLSYRITRRGKARCNAASHLLWPVTGKKPSIKTHSCQEQHRVSFQLWFIGGRGGAGRWEENQRLPSSLKQFVSSPPIPLHCNDTSVTSEQHQAKKFGRRSSRASNSCSSLRGLCLKVTHFIKMKFTIFSCSTARRREEL